LFTGTVGTNLFSNDLIGVVRYPDKTTGLASTAASDDQTFGYNLLGELSSFTDQNGTTHTYTRDVLGRETLDSIQVASGNPQNVDQTILSLGYTFDTAGRPYQQTAFTDAAGTTVANQVEDIYNGYGQLITQYQDTTGAVPSMPNPSTTPAVQYAYAQPGMANYSRMVSMTYPNLRILDYGYNTEIDATISRISYLKDDAGSSIGVHLEEYSYLGLGTIVIENRPEIFSELTYVKQTGDTHFNSDGGDQYTGLDRFGRVIDQFWLNTATATTTDRFQYAYDRDGNVLYKNNLVNPTFSELYHANAASSGDDNTAYDSLNRLTAFRRGTLTASGDNGTVLDTITTANLNSTTGVPNTNSWTLDALGNWTNSALSGSQTRTFNSTNQITAISGASTPTYDNNGNMLTDEIGKHYVFDAWNRQVTVKATNNTTVLETFVYGAASHPMVENNGSGNDNWYYTPQGQLIEETYSTTYDQFVWGLAYVNELILRDRNADASATTGTLGKAGSGLEERIYSQYDANYNTTSLITQAASVKERFIYDSYGASVVLTPAWAVGTDGTNYWWYRYQGMRLDNTDALYMSQSRFYSPSLGRWVTVDPIGYADTMNSYQFVDGAPITNVDASGQECADPCAAIRDQLNALINSTVAFVNRDFVLTQNAIQSKQELAQRMAIVNGGTAAVDVGISLQLTALWLTESNVLVGFGSVKFGAVFDGLSALGANLLDLFALQNAGQLGKLTQSINDDLHEITSDVKQMEKNASDAADLIAQAKAAGCGGVNGKIPATLSQAVTGDINNLDKLLN
jgi:RHS repeat-associated protein